MQHMQHNNRKNLTKKHRISAVCSHFLIYQLSKTRPDRISCAEGDIRIYFGSVEVLLGDGGYEEKLQQVPPILEKLSELYPETAGTLHLENYDPGSESIPFVPAG